MLKTRDRPPADDTPFISFAQMRTVKPRFETRRVSESLRAYPRHRHDYFQILYYRSNAPQIRIGLTTSWPRAGTAYFIAPMTPHQVRFDKETICDVIYFDGDFLRSGLLRTTSTEETLARAPELLPFWVMEGRGLEMNDQIARTVEHRIGEMQRHHNSSRICAGESAKANLILMLAEICQGYEATFARHMTMGVIGARHGSALNWLTDYICDTYRDRPNLTDAAAASRLSKSRLCVVIKEQTGMTFMGLVTELRIQEACDRLLLSNQPIGVVALSVGYRDEKYFFRAFKALTGTTPKAFRDTGKIVQSSKTGATREK